MLLDPQLHHPIHVAAQSKDPLAHQHNAAQSGCITRPECHTKE